jgi:hypothetical protein
MFMNPTEMFESTGSSAIHSDDDNELSGDDVQTSTHMPIPMTLHTTISAAAATTIETIMEQQSNRLFAATDDMGEQQQRHFTVPNESSVNSHHTNVTLVSYNLSNFNNNNNSNSNNSMTLSHDDNNRNSSNISFNNIKFTTMKPCKPLSSHIVHSSLLLTSHPLR